MKGKKIKNTVIGVILVLFILILVCLIGGGISFFTSFSRFNSNVHPVSGTQSVADGGVVNILLTGTDVSGQRTDTILIISYHQQSKTMKVVSVPRDTLVELNGRRAKINAANEYGGQSLLITTVEDLLKIKINYYASVNYVGFDKLIDSIGGVNMTIPYNMDYDDPVQNLHIHFTKGANVHLNGKEAEEFFRWRKNNDGSGLPTGDLGRTDNQHTFLLKVLEKIKQPLGFIKVPAFVSEASKSITTDMKAKEIITYGIKMATVDRSKVEMATLQGSTPYIGGESYFAYDAQANAALVSSLRDSGK
jgi:LCP family protein required for cell wall assembly